MVAVRVRRLMKTTWIKGKIIYGRSVEAETVRIRCDIASMMTEVDRIVRPGEKLIVRDEANAIVDVEKFF
ncbi:methyltransferase PMT27 [Tripterygium wilfordii]|uniref:Methyltransferase PMT27 n=1 Tax=Tripterygium wilfordii TaxID=458696 RepID=A0A7J7CPU0_TRIWF|nr:methyltransferase PMT27 [Tripterygium wilfordii]